MSLFSQLYRQSTAGTTLSCTGLDGDRHGIYRIRFKLWFVTPSTSSDIYLRPNGVSTNLRNGRSSDFASPAVDRTVWDIGSHPNSSNDLYMSGTVSMDAARTLDGSSVRRTYTAESWAMKDSASGGTAAQTSRNSGGIWLDSTNNLTSVVITSSSEDIAVGSYVYIEQVLADNALA